MPFDLDIDLYFWMLDRGDIQDDQRSFERILFGIRSEQKNQHVRMDRMQRQLNEMQQQQIEHQQQQEQATQQLIQLVREIAPATKQLIQLVAK